MPLPYHEVQPRKIVVVVAKVLIAALTTTPQGEAERSLNELGIRQIGMSNDIARMHVGRGKLPLRDMEAIVWRSNVGIWGTGIRDPTHCGDCNRVHRTVHREYPLDLIRNIAD